LQESDDERLGNKNGGSELTAVDDVRRVRERLDRESGGSIQSLIEQSNRALEEHREKLGLKVVQPPMRPARCDGTGG
jgi:hypothetical protein